MKENAQHFKYQLIHRDQSCQARAGLIQTPHGSLPTPVFMPVGTHGAIKALAPWEVERMDQPIILANTYHLHLSPGERLIEKLGGLHAFMAWPRAILTDSGGFQVFSLQQKSLSEEGASFKDHKGRTVTLTPESSIAIQQALGSDIMMAFDECIPYPASRAYVKESMARTHRWLRRCEKSWSNPRQSLFGIIQGGTYGDLRQACLEEVCSVDLPGYAIGGVSVGEGPELMEEAVGLIAPQMPAHKPRYVMGVGTPEDLLVLWENGVDMSDCIIPTKYARGGTVFTNRGKIRIQHKNYRHDQFPLEPNCPCLTCQKFSRAYLKHLFDANEILGAILVTLHNIAFYQSLAARARQAILEDRFLAFKREFLAEYRR